MMWKSNGFLIDLDFCWIAVSDREKREQPEIEAQLSGTATTATTVVNTTAHLWALCR